MSEHDEFIGSLYRLAAREWRAGNESNELHDVLREAAVKLAAALRERDEARDRLAVAVEALDSIASWDEGAEVTGKFDEPGSADHARKALAAIRGTEKT